MIADPALRAARFRSLARSNGTLALVALDQRESLRTLLADAGAASEDRALVSFKVEAAAALSPLASGLLIDPDYGLRPVVEASAISSGCGLIVAVDRLTQQRGEPVQDAGFDAGLDLDGFVRLGAVALKLLVLWRRDDDPTQRRVMVERFVARCAELGVLSVLEGIARAPRDGSWDRDADALAAAGDLAAARPDLYKAEVPTLGEGSAREVEAGARRITDAVGGPWVVLSAGVRPERFPDAVAGACRGGASGFLAGRAIWTAALGPGDVARRLRERAVPRLGQLASIVDAGARPWSAA